MGTSKFETKPITLKISEDCLLIISISKHKYENYGNINIYLMNTKENSTHKIVNIKIINGKIIIGEKINERL